MAIGVDFVVSFAADLWAVDGGKESVAAGFIYSASRSRGESCSIQPRLVHTLNK